MCKGMGGQKGRREGKSGKAVWGFWASCKTTGRACSSPPLGNECLRGSSPWGFLKVRARCVLSCRQQFLVPLPTFHAFKAQRAYTCTHNETDGSRRDDLCEYPPHLTRTKLIHGAARSHLLPSSAFPAFQSGHPSTRPKRILLHGMSIGYGKVVVKVTRHGQAGGFLVCEGHCFKNLSQSCPMPMIIRC